MACQITAALHYKLDQWIPACGGSESWTRFPDGSEFLYVYNPATNKHGWLDRTDIVRDSLPASTDPR